MHKSLSEIASALSNQYKSCVLFADDTSFCLSFQYLKFIFLVNTTKDL
jgi:hypothetical protein